jgi:hypothetical protein
MSVKIGAGTSSGSGSISPWLRSVDPDFTKMRGIRNTCKKVKKTDGRKVEGKYRYRYPPSNAHME